jgi:TolB-like protein
MSQGRGFFYELKRRHVVRVAIAYAVAAWVLLQLASIVFPALGAPDWVLRVVIALIAFGFPIALILAWAFELTPDGIRRTEPAHSPEARAPEDHHRVGRSLNVVVIGALVLAIAVLLWRQFGSHATTGEPRAAAAGAAAPGKSIAVLPFDNLSDDKSNGYFATGMQDEILTRLAGIHALKVISRTSTEKYASHPTDLKTVGRELDVASVLEGSVQKAGDKVHINVQLIDTGNDDHLWAQSYDRDLKDIFAVERDVAQSIADALKATLQPQEKALVAAVPTTNPAAYDLYLRAIEHFNRARDQDVLTATEMPQAIVLFEQSLEADPKFALVAALAGEAHMFIYFNGIDRGATRLAAAKASIDRALAVQPDLGEAHYALALFHYYGHRDYASALQELDRAQQSLPNSAYVAVASAAIARRQGRWNEAIVGFQRAALFDPRSSAPLDQLGLTYAALRRYADADQAFSRSVSVSADPADERVTQAINTVRWKGDLGPLRTVLQVLTPGSDAFVGNAASRYQFDMYSQDYAAAARVADSDPAGAWGDQGNIVLPRELYLALAYASMGDKEKAGAAYARVRSSMVAALAQQPDAADLHLALGLAAAGLASKDDALREGRRAAELMPPSRDNISGSGVLVWLAQIEAMVGERDAAFDHLRHALALPSGGSISPSVLKLDPAWDPLRRDPRFDALLEQGETAVSVAPHG